MSQTEISSGKFPGIDEIPAEHIMATGKGGTKIVTILCKKIWETCEWPIDWRRSIDILLPKKGDIKKCSNHPKITLISHASKVLLKIIQKKIQSYLEFELPQEQAGFRKGKGTRDHTANLR